VSYALAGLNGFGAFGGTFAPDCYLSSPYNKGETLGKPMTATEIAGFMNTYGAAATPVIAACQQSADPKTCAGQYFLAKPFLGRPCKLEWIEWVRSKTAGGGVTATPPAQMPTVPIETDNTLLYAGIGAVAVVGIGAFFLLKKK
jgi:hypothetical protein